MHSLKGHFSKSPNGTNNYLSSLALTIICHPICDVINLFQCRVVTVIQWKNACVVRSPEESRTL